MQNLTKFILFCTTLLVATQNISHAATIVVNSNQDSGDLDNNCELREAILAANVNFSVDGCTAGQAGVTDLIIVQAQGPIQLASTLPVFSSVAITTTFNADPVEIVAAPGRRIMRVVPISENDNDFTMINFKLTGGEALDENSGGAIYFNGEDDRLGIIELSGMIFENNHAHIGGALHFENTQATSLSINNNIFVGNTADNIAGAIAGDRVVRSDANSSLTITFSHFENNHSDGTAGAVFIRNEAAETASISDNHFINNSAVESIGAVGVGAWVETQTFELNRNVYLFNQAGTNSGAVQISFSAIAYVRDSLFAFNSAQTGGAITSLFDDSLLRLSGSTLVHNSASSNGDNIHIFSTGRLVPSNNIVAYPVNGDNCSGGLNTSPPSSARNNITDDSSCELLNSPSLSTQADPLLSGFSSHPDYYPGFAPTTDSPALDSASFCSDKDVMRRDRPIDGDGNGQAFCDIGAIESPTSIDLIWSDSFGLWHTIKNIQGMWSGYIPKSTSQC